MNSIIKAILIVLIMMFVIWGINNYVKNNRLHNEMQECREKCLLGEMETRTEERRYDEAFINIENSSNIRCTCHYARKLFGEEQWEQNYTSYYLK